jgi:transposase
MKMWREVVEVGQVFYPYEPDQGLLLPPSLRDWMPPGHLAHFISDTVDQLDLEALYARYQEREDGRGQLAYEPRLMLKLLIYGYAVGIFSSRKLARALEDLVPLRYLAAGNRPSHRTLARFREQHIGEFQQLFVQVVRIAQAAGLVRMGTLACDGTKVKANASKHKAMSYGRMRESEQRLKREIERITELAQQIDRAEDQELGPDFRGDELPEELQRRETRLAKIQEAMRKLEAAQAEQDAAEGRGQSRPGALQRANGTPADKKQINFTDPQSRLMKTASGGFEQCYNAQLAVDDQQLMIVATAVADNAADQPQLQPLEQQAESNTGQRAGRLLADAGYKSEANFAALAQRGIDAYISLGRGEQLPGEQRSNGGRWTRKMKHKLQSRRGRLRFKARKAIVEPAVGWIKQVIGFRAFSMRGLRKAAGEWSLVCAAVDLRRMAVLLAT